MFPAYHREAFKGTVTDTRLVSGEYSVYNVLFKITYAAQLGFDASWEEETYEDLLTGMKLCKALNNPVSAMDAAC